MAFDSSSATNVGQGERILSTVLGAALVVNGVVRPSLWHTFLAFAGAALAQRGLTGHCSLYSALGMNTAGEPQQSLPQQQRHEYLSDGDHKEDPVLGASEDSFPASDPPSWTPVAGTARR